jgi:hypothetical protein
MTNIVRWHDTEEAGTKEISSDTSIEVVVQVRVCADRLGVGWLAGLDGGGDSYTPHSWCRTLRREVA